MRLKSNILAALAALAILAACSGADSQGESTTPRPKAFPRIESYGSEYRAIDSMPLHIEANAKAHVRIVSSESSAAGADIVYPRYGATIHLSALTLSADDPAHIDRLLRSRLERAALNLGSTQSTLSESINDAGFSLRLIRADAAVPTPVQLIATDGRRHLLSATAFISFTPSTSATDSLAPVVDALAADLRHLADNLRP